MAKANQSKNNTKNIWIIVAVIAVIAVVIGGVFIANNLIRPARLVVSSGQTNIEVVKGQEFEIDLTSNASTGYSWAVADTYDKNVITKVSSTYIATVTDKVGVPGSEQWVFKGTATGSTQLTFNYARQWEAASSQADSKTYTVTVK